MIRAKIEKLLVSLLCTENGELLRFMREDGSFDETTTAILRDIREEMEGLRKDLIKDESHQTFSNAQRIGFNQAIDQIKEKLT